MSIDGNSYHVIGCRTLTLNNFTYNYPSLKIECLVIWWLPVATVGTWQYFKLHNIII